MSIFSALNTAVIGLQSQSFALEAISGNIANVETAGFKRVDTSFEDLVAVSAARTQQAGSVAAFSRGTTSLAGSIKSTGRPTHFALDGGGFVAVKQRIDSGNATPSFSAGMQFTRRGDFEIDRDGYLVNGAGLVLAGYPVDPVTNSPKGSTPDAIKVAVGLSPSRATTVLGYSANLPSKGKTPAVAARTTTSDLWTEAHGTAPATVGPSGSPTSASFADNSISGQSPRLYDAKGTPVDLELRWAKIAAPDGGGSTWALYYNATPGTAAMDATWKLATTSSFNANGVLTSPTAAQSLDLASVGLGTVSLDLTGGRLTQFTDQSGEASVSRIEQDGYAAGVVQSVSVSGTGRVVASFSNGQTQDLAQIAVARFQSPDGLSREGGGAFSETLESGEALYASEGTTFLAGSLEGSNADIAEEFSKMIVTQQAYSANTRVISTAQQMMQEVMNILR